MSLRVRVALTLLAAFAVVFGLAGPASAETTRKFTTLTFTTRVVSSGTTLTTQPGGHTFGWNNLSGPTRWGNQDATVTFLGDVDYTDGSGPFNGYVTVTRADGTRLSFRTEGAALAVPETSGATVTYFTGAVRVIQGTGAFRGAVGIGTMTGERDAALGSPVELTFRLSLLRR